MSSTRGRHMAGLATEYGRLCGHTCVLQGCTPPSRRSCGWRSSAPMHDLPPGAPLLQLVVGVSNTRANASRSCGCLQGQTSQRAAERGDGLHQGHFFRSRHGRGSGLPAGGTLRRGGRGRHEAAPCRGGCSLELPEGRGALLCGWAAGVAAWKKQAARALRHITRHMVPQQVGPWLWPFALQAVWRVFRARRELLHEG